MSPPTTPRHWSASMTWRRLWAASKILYVRARLRHLPDTGVSRLYTEDEGWVATKRPSTSNRRVETDDNDRTQLRPDHSKIHANRLCLFDLPAELRTQIYALINLDKPRVVYSYNDESASGSIGYAARKIEQSWHQSTNIDNFVRLQLVSLRFRSEFLANWAERAEHHVDMNMRLWRTKKGKRGVGTTPTQAVRLIAPSTLGRKVSWACQSYLRDFEARFGAAKSVRKLQLFCSFWNNNRDNHDVPACLLRDIGGLDMARRIECPNDKLARADLQAELEIVCMDDGGHQAVARRRFVLRLTREFTRDARPALPDWQCIEDGPVYKRHVHHLDCAPWTEIEWRLAGGT